MLFTALMITCTHAKILFEQEMALNSDRPQTERSRKIEEDRTSPNHATKTNKTQSWRNTALDAHRLFNKSKDHSKGLTQTCRSRGPSKYIKLNFSKRFESYQEKRLTSNRRILDYLLACLLPHSLSMIAKGRLREGDSKWQRYTNVYTYKPADIK